METCGFFIETFLEYIGKTCINSYMKLRAKESLKARLNKIKAIVTDVDGVLTDGGIYLSGDAEEMKRFSAKDGSMTELAQQAGILVILVTGRKCQATIRRAKEMSADVFFKHDLGLAGKSFLEVAKEKYGISQSEILYVGDDIGDISMMRKVGVSATPADGVAFAKSAADIITKRAGGEGVIAEVIEALMKAQSTWNKSTERFKVTTSSDFDAKI